MTPEYTASQNCVVQVSLTKSIYLSGQQTSDYLVVYLRLITSGQLQTEEEFYSNFLEGDKTMKEFCQQVILKIIPIESEILIKFNHRRWNLCTANLITCTLSPWLLHSKWVSESCTLIEGRQPLRLQLTTSQKTAHHPSIFSTDLATTTFCMSYKKLLIFCKTKMNKTLKLFLTQKWVKLHFLISVLWDRKIQNEKTMPVPVYESLNIKFIQLYIFLKLVWM